MFGQVRLQSTLFCCFNNLSVATYVLKISTKTFVLTACTQIKTWIIPCSELNPYESILQSKQSCRDGNIQHIYMATKVVNPAEPERPHRLTESSCLHNNKFKIFSTLRVLPATAIYYAICRAIPLHLQTNHRAFSGSQSQGINSHFIFFGSFSSCE
jgi:hypothetical protein